jgi:HAE1 family hydrophobic/amphiphilic exporter-1
VFTLFNTATPQVYADIDRTKAEMLGVPITGFFDTLSTYMGSTYINDFNILGRTYRVTAQADNPFRLSLRDVENLRARSSAGEMVPLGSVATFQEITAPYRMPRYNLFPAAEVQGATLPGYSTGQAIAAMENLLATNLPAGFGFEWTEIALQEKIAGNTAAIAFSLAVVFVFLLLAAQYESLLLPLGVILIVPMCLFAAISGVLIRGMDNNILTQIGFVVLIGLAAKNAILIVEFSRQAEERGEDRYEAAVHAARTRLRPILMTSFAFVLGVLPLVLATGAGAEMRQALGTAVFFGMLGVTLFGLLFTPVFYVLVRYVGTLGTARKSDAPAG